MMKPMIQAVFEQLCSVGVRDFCIITGRGKREIEDHFTADWPFLDALEPSPWKTDLEEFYRQIETTRIFFVNQARKKGFGDAILHSENFVGSDPFVVHAGDDIVHSRGQNHLHELANLLVYDNADAVVLAQELPDPRGYGVILGESISSRVVQVTRIEEKPSRPSSRIAVIAVYAFRPSIFRAIRSSGPGLRGEIQLTSGIQSLLDDGKKVLAFKLGPDDVRIDIGTADKYIDALAHSAAPSSLNGLLPTNYSQRRTTVIPGAEADQENSLRQSSL